MSSVSASQINDALQCLRKWAWRQIDRVPSVPHRSAENGTRVHAILEAWLTNGTPPDLEERLVLDGREYRPGLIAMNGMHHLPPPGPHILVERGFQFRHWLGRIDWLMLGEDGIPTVGDHKTTGNFGFALDENTLRTDPQGIVYANAVLDELPEAPAADLHWTYFGTTGQYPSKKVHLRMHRDEAETRIQPLDRLAEGLLKIRASGLRAMDLPPSPEACENYGGCPHRQRCGLSSEQLMKGFFRMEQMSIEQKIAEATSKVNGVQTTSALVQPASVTPGWAVHPQSAAHEWNPATGEVRLIAVAPTPPPPVVQPQVVTPPPVVVPTQAVPPAAYVMPPPVVQAPPVVALPALPAPPLVQPAQYPVAPPPPIVQPPSPAGLPPIVAMPTPPPIGPDGLPFGSVNPPEAPTTDKAEPSPVTAATGAKDDLDLMSKEQLVALAASMGVVIKGLREKGAREKLRAARAAGGVVGTMPSGATVTQREVPDAIEQSQSHTDRVIAVACAMIQGGAFTGGTPESLVGWAKQIVELIESE